MTTEQATPLKVSRRFAATREEVFDAWTNPDVLKRWWAGSEKMTTPSAEVDARPGGRYRLSMHDPESGATHTVGGEYREVVRPERLVYTWAWEAGPEQMHGGEDTTVTVEFIEDGQGTQVVITHEGLAEGEVRQMHEHGWNGVLENLARRVFPD